MKFIIQKYNKILLKKCNQIKTKNEFLDLIEELYQKNKKRQKLIQESNNDYGRSKYTRMHTEYLEWLRQFGYNLFKNRFNKH